MSREQPLPYGITDLTNEFIVENGKVRCYVAGCKQMLRPPTREFRGDYCPEHQIACHISGSRTTYTYRNAERNLIASPNLFTRRVRRNPAKFESHRFGMCNSEDASTWNVFRSLQEAGLLHLIAQYVTGEPVRSEPLLYLWGLSSWDNKFEPWSLLTEARRRFEINKLPVKRPLTEPDAATWIPGKLLILIEAKLQSHNPIVYAGRPRQTAMSLTLEELLELYADPKLQILDKEKVAAADMTYPQLHRNMIFAEYLAQLDSPTTQAYLVNLVKAGEEHECAFRLPSVVIGILGHWTFTKNSTIFWQPLKR